MHPFFEGHRAYSRNEIRADALVHGAGILAALTGSIALLAHAGVSWVLASYLFGLVVMLACSAVYNLTPPSQLKWILRRFDHSAIFLLIAGTYTPLLPFLPDAAQGWTLGLVTWLGAAFGIAMKFIFPGRFDRLAILVYLALGWVGVTAAGAFMQVLPPLVINLIIAGGILYTAGVIFYIWESLKFHNAIWHGFVAAAATCHFAAISLLYY
ncbi:MAG TPA: hemolysin III family protein [Aestuariivirga sp.]|nr:hemolysin III family protein [Aestuariivirga sp.]